MRKIAAVTFDLWDTLIQEHPGGSEKVAGIRVGRIGSVLASAGAPHTREEIMAAHEKTGQFLQLVWSKKRDLPLGDQVLFLLNSIDGGLPGRLRKEDLREIEEAYSASILDNPPRLLPGVKDALGEVKGSGYRTGLISNTGRTPGSTLRTLMGRLGILDFFDTTTFSNEILVRKPAPEAFRSTLDRLKTSPRMSVHIGDDPVSDIAGAKRAGMSAIQVVPEGKRPSEKADSAVSSLVTIPSTIRKL